MKSRSDVLPRAVGHRRVRGRKATSWSTRTTRTPMMTGPATTSGNRDLRPCRNPKSLETVISH